MSTNLSISLPLKRSWLPGSEAAAIEVVDRDALVKEQAMSRVGLSQGMEDLPMLDLFRTGWQQHAENAPFSFF